MCRVWLAALFFCCVLQPVCSPGQVVGTKLIDFFEDFSEQQGLNGLTYRILPDDPVGGIPELVFENPLSTSNGSQTFEGPAFIGSGGLPFGQQELSREFLALHPSPASGMALEYSFQMSGSMRIVGDFARANDFQNAGDGVEVGIYLNDLSTPIFETLISSSHEVDSSIGGDVFIGTGAVSFDETITVQPNDVLLFAVFAGEDSDAGFDVTALRGMIFSVPEATQGFDLFDSFSDAQGVNGLKYLGFGDGRPSNITNPSQAVLELPFFAEPPMFFRPGPLFAQSDFFPHIQADEAGYLLLHPEATTTGALGAAVAFTSPKSGVIRLSGDFARANAARNAGNGVHVGIYNNRDFLSPIFESAISADHDADLSNVFAGTSTASFNETFSVDAGDQIEFVVFTGPQGVDLSLIHI